MSNLPAQPVAPLVNSKPASKGRRTARRRLGAVFSGAGFASCICLMILEAAWWPISPAGSMLSLGATAPFTFISGWTTWRWARGLPAGAYADEDEHLVLAPRTEAA